MKRMAQGRGWLSEGDDAMKFSTKDIPGVFTKNMRGKKPAST